MIEQELDRFLETLAAIRAPILDRRRPGLSRKEVDEALDALGWPDGLEVPPEAYAWWGWQNGTVDRTSADNYTTWTIPVISPAGLILRSMEALIAKWTASWISVDARPAMPYVPLGTDGEDAGPYGLTPDADGVWRMSYYFIDYTGRGQWRRIHIQGIDLDTADTPSPTLAEYLRALTDSIQAGHVGVVITGGIFVLDDSEEGESGAYPWSPETR